MFEDNDGNWFKKKLLNSRGRIYAYRVKYRWGLYKKKIQYWNTVNLIKPSRGKLKVFVLSIKTKKQTLNSRDCSFTMLILEREKSN